MFNASLALGLLMFAQEAAAPAKPAAQKIEMAGKYQISGQKMKLSANLAAPPAPQAPESIEVKGSKALISTAIGPEVKTESIEGGGQKRSVEWLLPAEEKLPIGPAEISWKCGDQVIGPASILVLKEIKDVDWDKADDAMIAKAAVLIETDFGQMLLDFYPEKAPNTVRNFLKLAGKGFYNGVTFHRILKDKMIQGGDPTGTGSGDPGYKIKAEFNDVQHTKGVLSMARTKDPDSAGCQFFVVHSKHMEGWDGQYTAFGIVKDGLDTLDKLASVPVEMAASRKEASKPKTKVYMRKVSVVEKPAGSQN